MANEAALPKHFLRRCLLLLLRERADYGYDLVERLAAFGFDGSDPGGVYRALRGMERDRLVRSAWRPSGAGPYRRVYELTFAGQRELARGATELAHCQEMLGTFIERYAGNVPLPAR
jgi:PadR family transcriptional regulator, regulatory protein PadR